MELSTLSDSAKINSVNFPAISLKPSVFYTCNIANVEARKWTRSSSLQDIRLQYSKALIFSSVKVKQN